MATNASGGVWESAVDGIPLLQAYEDFHHRLFRLTGRLVGEHKLTACLEIFL